MVDFIPLIIPMDVAVDTVALPMEVSVSDMEIPMEVSLAYEIVSGDWYDGEYEVTPSTTEQVLMTRGKTMRENVVINPIPSDWGHITWNGSVLTVS